MSTLKCDNLQNSAGTKTVPMNTVVDGSAKAWVNFNGTGTVAINASFNVSSITDGGAGIYTINFSTAMVDKNYAVAITTSSDLTTAMLVYEENTYAGRVSSSVKVATSNNSGTPADRSSMSVMVFR